MLPNGHIACLDMALGPDATATCRRRQRYAALLLGILREDVLLLPLGYSLPNPSFDHFYPWSRRRCAKLFRAAVQAGANGRPLRGAFLLGGAIHIIIDMACPSHAKGVVHMLEDPYEIYVDAHSAELARLPVPELPELAAAGPTAIIDSIARAARREDADLTKSLWGRWLARRGRRRVIAGALVKEQAARLLPLAAAHIRALIARYDHETAEVKANGRTACHR
jgi:hypothetical protein